ncbi:MAG TPA: HTTM domain-containing protein [Thermoanaerobaculia bacterium]|nr:HTTM domain-containing protein [Thermoanaerobaculia bacterium]
MNPGRIRSALFTPIGIAHLVFFRVAFGAAMLVEVCRYFAHGWIARDFIEPRFFFTYYGFDWVRPWAGRGMYAHFALLGLFAFCILIGFRYRLAVALFFLGFTYVFLLDATRYLNHFYLIALLSFLMIFVPAEGKYSVDALIDPSVRADAAPAWTLWLLRAQIAIPYFYGGLAKLSGDWLRGEPMRMWLGLTNEWLVYAFVIGGILVDLLIVPALLWRKTRVFALIVAAVFHLANARLFHIGIFPWLMLAATLLFLPARVMGPPAEAAGATQWLLGTYLLVQLLVPLRHFLYPGDVSWTEEGHKFAWQMKLRDKEAEAMFFVTDRRTGKMELVDPRSTLTELQRAKMAGDPDMILQFAHWLGGDTKAVHAHVLASLNGRKPQLLIDPDVDLTRERRGFGHATWILPLTEPLR